MKPWQGKNTRQQLLERKNNLGFLNSQRVMFCRSRLVRFGRGSSGVSFITGDSASTLSSSQANGLFRTSGASSSMTKRPIRPFTSTIRSRLDISGRYQNKRHKVLGLAIISTTALGVCAGVASSSLMSTIDANSAVPKLSRIGTVTHSFPVFMCALSFTPA